MKIFGRDWKQIQSAQQGGSLDIPVRHEDDIVKYRKADLNLLKKYGTDGLRKMEYFGVLDRLKRAGMIPKEVK